MNTIMKVKIAEVDPILKRVRQLKDFISKNRKHLTMEQLNEVGEIIGYKKTPKTPSMQRSEYIRVVE